MDNPTSSAKAGPHQHRQAPFWLHPRLWEGCLWVLVAVLSVLWLHWFGQALYMLTRLFEYWVLILIVLLMLLMVRGNIGVGLGVPELFRLNTDDRRPWMIPLMGSAGVTNLILIVLINIYILDWANHHERLETDAEPMCSSISRTLFVVDEEVTSTGEKIPTARWLENRDDLEQGQTVREYYLPPEFLVICSPPFLAVLMIVVWFPSGRREREWRAIVWETVWYLLGIGIGVGWALAWNLLSIEAFLTLGGHDSNVIVGQWLLDVDSSTPASRAITSRVILAFWVELVIVLLLMGIVVVYPRRLVTPGLAISPLLQTLVIVYYLLALIQPQYVPSVLLFGLLWIWLCNRQPFRNRFPNMTVGNTSECYYSSPVDLNCPYSLELEDDDRKSHPSSTSTDQQPRGLRELTVLESWRQRNEKHPNLVLVAVSGGAYRAAFWVATVLDRLAQDKGLVDFPEKIRLMTGASGGMVGAAYFVARMQGKQIGSVRDSLEEDTGRDSLTTVAHQFIRRDVPLTFFPWPSVYEDRGVALEREWKQLDLPFRKLRDGEESAELPSLIVSPMIVETGQQLLISNLDLSPFIRENELPLAQPSLSFYHLFPQADNFNLQTAIRMNATFPYASPAVSLPTRPPLRVVDAGYLDNFGLGILVEWLHHHREWLESHTSGITLIEIRAFATREHSEEDEPTVPVAEGFGALGGLTGPLEAVLSARTAQMGFHSSFLAATRDLFNEATTDTFHGFRSFEFEYPGKAAMDWFISKTDLNEMDQSLESPFNSEQMARLVEWWKETT